MSQNLEDLTQAHAGMTRFQFLRAAGIAGAAVLASPLLSACGAGGESDSRDANPKPTASRHSASGLHEADPLDFSHLPDGRLDAWPWRYDLDSAVPGYTHEAAKYDNKHAWIHERHLIISATRARHGYKSSRIDTLGNWTFKHGTITAEYLDPNVVGGWPAIWFMPVQSQIKDVLAKHHIKDKDPEKDYEEGGEIDLSEVYTWQRPLRNQATVHTKESMDDPNNDGMGIAHAETMTPNAAKRYQKLRLLKAPGLIAIYVNGKQVLHAERKPGATISEWPFEDFDYYPIINFAMGEKGGHNFAGEMRNEFPPYGVDNSHVPAYFAVRSLHYEPLPH